MTGNNVNDAGNPDNAESIIERNILSGYILHKI